MRHVAKVNLVVNHGIRLAEAVLYHVPVVSDYESEENDKGRGEILEVKMPVPVRVEVSVLKVGVEELARDDIRLDAKLCDERDVRTVLRLLAALCRFTLLA